ncbi:MAG TPA: hypothetical protein VGU20_16885 [Stellaceae bacterium]|nr:hypothetical protein [Stellaceae bacterium]
MIDEVIDGAHLAPPRRIWDAAERRNASPGRVVMRRAPDNWNVSQRMKFDGNYKTIDPLFGSNSLSLAAEKGRAWRGLSLRRSVKVAARQRAVSALPLPFAALAAYLRLPM